MIDHMLWSSELPSEFCQRMDAHSEKMTPGSGKYILEKKDFFSFVTRT